MIAATGSVVSPTLQFEHTRHCQ